MKKRSFFIGILLLFTVQGYAKNRWIFTEYQFDSRNFNTFHFMGFSEMPKGFSIWGFVDFESRKGNTERDSDLSTYFHEIDLRSPRWNGLGAVLEHNSSSGEKNDVGRVGVYYIPKLNFLDDINLFLHLKYLLLESDGEGSQISFSWNLKFSDFFQGRVSFGGFADWNFKSGQRKDTNLVSDTQVRILLVENLSALVEYRRNEFLDGNRDGVGIGMKYQF